MGRQRCGTMCGRRPLIDGEKSLGEKREKYGIIKTTRNGAGENGVGASVQMRRRRFTEVNIE